MQARWNTRWPTLLNSVSAEAGEVQACGDELAFDSRSGGANGLEYRFRVWLPAPFHTIGVVEFTLDTADPRAVQLAIDRETAGIRNYANHRLAQLAEELADGERPEAD